MLKLVRSRIVVSALTMLAFGLNDAKAAYPDRAVRIIVGFGAGGFIDYAARLVAQKLRDKWGQPVVIENRPGAGGALAANVVASAPADGYTLLVAAESFTAPPAEGAPPLDPLKNFAPVIRLASSPMVAAVKVDGLPVNNLSEVVAYAKANPGKLRIGHGGAGVAPDLSARLLSKDADINTTLVAFNGMAPAIVGLLGGHIDMVFAAENTILPHATAGKLKMLAVASDAGLKARTDLPTVARELKLKSFSVTSWAGIIAPANTPKDIVDTIRRDADEVLKTAEVREAFAKQGAEVVEETSEDFTKHLAEDVARWAELQKNK